MLNLRNQNHIQNILDRVIIFFIFCLAAFIPFSIAGSEISYGGALLCWLLKGILTKKWNFQRTGFDLPFATLIVVGLLASAFSEKSAESFYNLRKFLLIPILYLIPAQVSSQKQLHQLVHVLIFFALGTAVFGIGKFLLTSWQKVIATQSTTMTWGALSVFFVLFWIGLFLFGGKNKQRWLYAIGFVPQFVALLFSYVRGAYLGTLGGFIVFAWLKSKRIFLYVLVALVIVFVFSPASLTQRIKSIADLNVGSTQLRLKQWQDSLRIIPHYPILGVGWIDLHDVHVRYAPPGADLSEDRFHIGHFHNNFVQITMIFGILGLVVFVWLFIQILRTEYRIFKDISSRQPFLQALALIGLATTIAFLINGLFDWTFGDEEVVIILYFTIAISLTAKRLAIKELMSNSEV
ncbi:hypothetical protein DRQ12_01800 [candidate division KSB1 bacterium]|nr:MAG: hypothetical protein DRQ12_01800 [candidate division KSB1 bacterium]